MLDRFKRSLKFKLLSVLALILALSFTIISLSIFSVQTSILSTMARQVNDRLAQTASQAGEKFLALETSTADSLNSMTENAVANLSTKTAAALSREEDTIKSGLEGMVKANAEVMSGLLKKITLNFIVEKNYTELRKYSRLASGSDEVIYVMYLEADGTPMPGYLDDVDDRIFEYMEKRPTEDEFQVVLEESRKDSRVLVHEQKIEYFGEAQGSIVVCLAKDRVNNQLKALTERFIAVRTANSEEITNTLGTESGKVLAAIQNGLKTVVAENRSAIDDTADLLKSSRSEAARKTARLILFTGLACCAGTLILIGFFLSRMFIKPVTRISEGLKDIAQGEGDLTKRLEVTSADEVGELGTWFNTFITRIHDIITDLAGSAARLDRSSKILTGLSGEMTEAAGNANLKTVRVGEKASAIADSMNTVAGTMEDSAANITMVAASAEEMTATIQEISGNTSRARSVTDEAVANVNSASGQIQALETAASEIEAVVESIADISAQVNLLSLNATIEAARAGEAGKGFAVVANEIKELAAQTETATNDIKEKVSGIQASAAGTIGQIKSISDVVGDVDGIVSTISAAVEEQSATTREIAASVGQVSEAIGRVNDIISQSSADIAEISDDITQLGDTSETISAKSTGVQQSAGELSELAQQQTRVVGKFKISS
ncbi:MAG TPA: hypothetical protein DHV36_08805 [Desulfobacteraceae bacterium]|nr:hypothetical protein [Desulfobacteraceae bacterium]